jgi:class 3 adenylate cyclase
MTGQPGIQTFLIADIRGYSRYTEEFGTEAATGLTSQFVELLTEEVEAHGGKVVEIRGDRLWRSSPPAPGDPRAVALQAQFDEAALDHDLPLRVGIGIDRARRSRRRQELPRRGANVAARLCARPRRRRDRDRGDLSARRTDGRADVQRSRAASQEHQRFDPHPAGLLGRTPRPRAAGC